jgi:hypothetical protein
MRHVIRTWFSWVGGFVAFATTGLIAQDFSVVPNSNQQMSQLLADGAPATRLQFVVTRKVDTVQGNSQMTLIYDQKSKLAWWIGSMGTAEPEWIVAKAADGGSLVGFRLARAQITLRISTNSADSILAAQSMLMGNLNKFAGVEREELPSIRLQSALGSEFFFGESPNPNTSDAKLRRVVASPDGWQLELDGWNSQSAIVLISKEFVVLKSTVKK